MRELGVGGSAEPPQPARIDTAARQPDLPEDAAESGQHDAQRHFNMMRGLFLYLSKRPALRRWMEAWPPSHKVTRRFVAGDTLEEALAVCERLQSEKVFSTLDHLGENVRTLEEASASCDAYVSALEQIGDRQPVEHHRDQADAVRLGSFARRVPGKCPPPGGESQDRGKPCGDRHGIERLHRAHAGHGDPGRQRVRLRAGVRPGIPASQRGRYRAAECRGGSGPAGQGRISRAAFGGVSAQAGRRCELRGADEDAAGSRSVSSHRHS